MSRILLLLGDSNVRRWHLNLGEPYLPVMDFVPSHNSEELSAALEQVRPSYQMVVFAGLTNIIVSAGSEATGGQIARLEAIQTAIRTTLTAIRCVFCFSSFQSLLFVYFSCVSRGFVKNRNGLYPEFLIFVFQSSGFKGSRPIVLHCDAYYTYPPWVVLASYAPYSSHHPRYPQETEAGHSRSPCFSNVRTRPRLWRHPSERLGWDHLRAVLNRQAKVITFFKKIKNLSLRFFEFKLKLVALFIFPNLTVVHW